MKSKYGILMIFLVSTGIPLLMIATSSCSRDGEETPDAIQYEAIQYTIDQPDGTTILLQSRGSGNGTNKAFFDIYIEDATGNVTAFCNDVWYTFIDISAEHAIGLNNRNEFVSGHIASIDSNYFVDINGGSEQGGVTYQFRTGSLQTLKIFPKPSLHPDTIYVHSETGGAIDIGKQDQWDDIFENAHGAIFWNGSTFTTNANAAHLYFTDYAGERMKEHMITVVPSTSGSFNNVPGYVITKTVYTYSAPKDAKGDIVGLSTSFPVKFSLQFTDNINEIQEIRFVPALISETEQ